MLQLQLASLRPPLWVILLAAHDHQPFSLVAHCIERHITSQEEGVNNIQQTHKTQTLTSTQQTMSPIVKLRADNIQFIKC